MKDILWNGTISESTSTEWLIAISMFDRYLRAIFMLHSFYFITNRSTFFCIIFKIVYTHVLTRTRVNTYGFIIFSRPDDQVISEITDLLYKENVSSDIVLSVTSLINTYCKLNHNCKENDKLTKGVMHIKEKIKMNMLIKENRDEVSRDRPFLIVWYEIIISLFAFRH